MSGNKSTGLKAVFLREIKRMFSRPLYLVTIFLLPAICILFFGTFMKQGLPENLPLGVIDQDNSATSRNAIQQIGATAANEVVAYYPTFSEARDAMQRGEIYAFIIFPKDFEKDALASRQPKIDFYYNSVYLISGSLLNKNLTTMTKSIAAAAGMQVMEARGIVDESTIMGMLLPISPEIHAIGNPWINYSVYLINVILPGLIGLIILLMTVYCVGIELKKSTGNQWLQTANNNMLIAVPGKLLPYTLCFSVVMVVVDIFLFKILNYPLNNNILWMFLASFCYVIANQAFAVFMIGTFPVLRDGLSFASLFGVLSFSFAGLSFPIEGMLPFLQSWSYIFPIRHFFMIYQDIALNGLSPVYALPQFLYLLLFLLLPFIVGKRLKNALITDRYPKK